MMGRAIVVAMAVIVTMSAHHVPGMSAAIACIEDGTSEEEVVAVRIASIDGEVPETVKPVQRTQEVGCSLEGLPLPVKQDIAQIQVPTLPIYAIDIVAARHAHQIVEVDFVCSLVLLISQVQFISHLVRQEQGLVPCLLITHCLARSCCQQHHCQGYHHLFHNSYFFNCSTLIVIFSRCKDRQKPEHKKRISPKLGGGNPYCSPYFFLRCFVVSDFIRNFANANY